MPQGRSGGPDTSPAHTAIYHPFATLTVVEPPATAGRSVTVGTEGTLIGRDLTCDLALANDRISRRHAIVQVHEGEYTIEDLGSTNGTRINGETVTGVRALHDGDRLTFANVQVEFRLTDTRPGPSQPSRSSPEESWNPQQATVAEPTLGSAEEDPPRSLRRDLQQAPGFSVSALLLAIGGSVVGTILTGAAGTGQWGTLAGAAVGPVISTVFSTKRTGEKGRVRGAAIVMLSLGALLITWAGFSVTDAAAGKSIVPGTDDRSSTFPEPRNNGNDSGGQTSRPFPSTSTSATPKTPIVAIDPVECGTVALGSQQNCPVTIRYNGKGRLHITGVEVTGPDTGDFTPGRECVDKWLEQDQTCSMTVRFEPSATTQRTATLVVHQNLPRPDRGTKALLTGSGATGPGPDPDTCLTGFVWREAVPGDHVCVTPETRTQTREDNNLAASRRDPAGGAFGPDTCLTGFVWREAVPGDRVCVSPATRTQAQEDNILVASRRVG